MMRTEVGAVLARVMLCKGIKIKKTPKNQVLEIMMTNLEKKIN